MTHIVRMPYTASSTVPRKWRRIVSWPISISSATFWFFFLLSLLTLFTSHTHTHTPYIDSMLCLLCVDFFRPCLTYKSDDRRFLISSHCSRLFWNRQKVSIWTGAAATGPSTYRKRTTTSMTTRLSKSESSNTILTGSRKIVWIR